MWIVERRIFTILSAVSLLVFVATVACLLRLFVAYSYLPDMRQFALLLLLTPAMPIFWLSLHVGKRDLLNFLSGLSLFLCVAMVVLWVRSYRVDDHVQIAWQTPGEFPGYTGIRMGSGGGSVTLEYGDDVDYSAYQHLGSYYDGIPVVNRTSTARGWGFGYSRAKGNTEIWVPHWVFVLSTAILPLLWRNSHMEKRRRLKLGLCLTCGYDLRASKERCPECGTPIPAQEAKA